jgi:hypothetical protein
MRAIMIVGIAAAGLGIATVHEAKAANTTPPPVAQRPVPPPAPPKAPVLSNQQLTPKPQPAPQIPANLPKPPEPSLANKITNGPPPTLRDLKGTNTPPPALPSQGVTIGRVGSPPPAGPTPQMQDTNSRSYSAPPSGVGVIGTMRLPGN